MIRNLTFNKKINVITVSLFISYLDDNLEKDIDPNEYFSTFNCCMIVLR